VCLTLSGIGSGIRVSAATEERFKEGLRLETAGPGAAPTAHVSRALLRADPGSGGVCIEVKLATRDFPATLRFLLSALFSKLVKELACRPKKAGQAFVRRLPECESAM
jgi:hypothetical protein